MPQYRKPLDERQRRIIAEIEATAAERDAVAARYRKLLLDLHLTGVSVRHVADEVHESPNTLFKWIRQERDRRREPSS